MYIARTDQNPLGSCQPFSILYYTYTYYDSMCSRLLGDCGETTWIKSDEKLHFYEVCYEQLAWSLWRLWLYECDVLHCMVSIVHHTFTEINLHLSTLTPRLLRIQQLAGSRFYAWIHYQYEQRVLSSHQVPGWSKEF